MTAQPASASPIPDDVTVCITSCGRLDLLDETLSSFRRWNTGGRFLLSEDSADAAVIDEVRRRYPDMTVLTGEKLQQALEASKAALEDALDRATVN